MTTTLNFGIVAGLTAAEQQQLSDLAEAYTYHQSRNAIISIHALLAESD